MFASASDHLPHNRMFEMLRIFESLTVAREFRGCRVLGVPVCRQFRARWFAKFQILSLL